MVHICTAIWTVFLAKEKARVVGISWGILLGTQKTYCAKPRGSPWLSPLGSKGTRDDQTREAGPCYGRPRVSKLAQGTIRLESIQQSWALVLFSRFRDREREAKKSAKAQRKKSAKKSESAERERKKARICAFSCFCRASHWKPGSRARRGQLGSGDVGLG